MCTCIVRPSSKRRVDGVEDDAMISTNAPNFDTQVVLDRVVGDNHRLGAYAEREKYERNEGIDVQSSTVSAINEKFR